MTELAPGPPGPVASTVPAPIPVPGPAVEPSPAFPAPPSEPVDERPAAVTRVVLLTGPSGAGKSRLAAESGLPVLRLDDFYRDGDDPALPRLPGGAVDWDHPDSWDARAAAAALLELCARGRTRLPVYDIGLSARTGEREFAPDGARCVIAEGIFAAELVAVCAREGILADALCLRNRPSTTFRRRLLRDVRQSRKPLLFLLRRGWTLWRAEADIVRGQERLGARPCGRDEALRRILRAANATAVDTGAPGPR
ncbi:uridine kinase family protein [Streptomyces alkaliphilus]|uniref:uridine kinase family protein n=1 Tax=Streptomyces alkaliphilus TaxID=1472722 RepID=UPI003F663608